MLLRDKDGRMLKPEIAKRIKDEEVQKVITLINKLIADSPDKYHSSEYWLLWEYTHPTINFRNLNDGNSSQSLSQMKKTLESIVEGIQCNINKMKA